jgi:hypothetical protein
MKREKGKKYRGGGRVKKTTEEGKGIKDRRGRGRENKTGKEGERLLGQQRKGTHRGQERRRQGKQDRIEGGRVKSTAEEGRVQRTGERGKRKEDKTWGESTKISRGGGGKEERREGDE